MSANTTFLVRYNEGLKLFVSYLQKRINEGDNVLKQFCEAIETVDVFDDVLRGSIPLDVYLDRTAGGKIVALAVCIRTVSWLKHVYNEDGYRNTDYPSFTVATFVDTFLAQYGL